MGQLFVKVNGAWVPSGGGDNVVSGPDTPPQNPAVQNDEFSGVALDAKWSPLNIENAATAVAEGFLKFGLTDPDSNEFHGLLQNAPAGNFSFGCKVWMPLRADQYFYAGLLLSNSTTGLSQSFGAITIGNSHQFSHCRINGAFAYDGNSFGEASAPGANGSYYLKAEKSGNDLKFFIGRNGFHYQQVASINHELYVGAGGNDRIGVVVWRNGSSTALDLAGSFEWFRRLS